MRYTKEFKLECVKKYIKGEYFENPGGCSHETFHHKVLNWYHIYIQLEEVELSEPKFDEILVRIVANEFLNTALRVFEVGDEIKVGRVVDASKARIVSSIVESTIK